jgi:hypothetical protein
VSRRPTLRTLAVLVAPATAATNGTVDEDFEAYDVGDTAPGPWEITQNGGTASQITDTSTLGTRSLLVQDSGDVATHTDSNLNTSNLLVEATIRGDGQGGTISVGSLSLEYDPNEFSDRLVLDDGTTEVIEDAQGFSEGQWVNLRLQGDGTDVQATVWPVGEAEPDTPNIQLSGAAISEGQLSASTSGSGDQLYIDQITAEPLAALDTSADDLESQAESLLSELEDPLPESFDRTLDPVDTFQEVDDTYAAVHTQREWTVDGTDIRDKTVTVAVTPDLGEPDVVLPAGQPLVISVWDSGDRSFVEDGVDGSLPGATTSGTIVMDQLGPTGETLSTQELETEPRLEYTAAANLGTKTHHAALATPSPGIYRVYPEDNQAAAYLISVGDPDEQARVIESDLRDRVDQLTTRADRVRGLATDGGLTTATTTTDADGNYSVELNRNVRAAHLTAYDAPDIRAGAEPTLADIRDRYESGAIDTLTLARESVVVQPPDNAVEITVTTTDAPPWADPAAFEQQAADQLESTLDESLTGLQRGLVDRTDELSESEVEELQAQLDGLRESNDRLADRLDDSEADLEATLDALESIQQTVDSSDPVTEISEGLLDYEVEFVAPIPDDAVAATIRYADGSTEVVDSEYVTVDQSGGPLTDSTTVRIDEYPIPDGAVAPQVRLQVAGSEGVGQSVGRLSNPAVDADLPTVNALSVSTLRPGPDDQVSVGIEAEDGTGYGGLVSGEVYAPDGTALDATVDAETDRLRFTTSGQGVHFVRAIYETQDGRQIAESVRVRAGESRQSTPPTIRSTEGVGGPLAVVGGGLQSAQIDDSDGLGIEAVVAGDERVPGVVHLYPQDSTRGSVDELSLAVVRGPDSEELAEHVGVRVHLDELGEEALVWRGDDPITVDGETRFGEVSDRGLSKSIVRSYTDSDGTVDLRVSHEASTLERVRHWVGVNSPVSFGGLA